MTESTDSEEAPRLAYASKSEIAALRSPDEFSIIGKESVIAAIKRLSATYPMLDKGKVFNDTSSLMSQHIIQGREAVEVIDELEALFQQEYNDFVKDRDAT